MIRDALLAFGVLMSTASQMRIGGSSVGPGEISLVLWLVIALYNEILGPGPRLTPALRRLITFWAIFAFAESLGTITAAIIGDKHDPEWFLHDIMAYPLIALVSCFSVMRPTAAHSLRQSAWLFAIFGTISLALQLINATGLISLLMVDPWYWDRLRGWSANPNQLAILCAGLVLISLHLTETATVHRTRSIALACTILPMVAGRLSGSDTFTVMIGATLLVFSALKLRTWLWIGDVKLNPRTSVAWVCLIGLPILLILSMPLVTFVSGQTEQAVMSLAKDSGKGMSTEANLRLRLWSAAIDRGLEAWMLGLGPGPHLDIPSTLVLARETADQPDNILHPQQGNAPNFEAHNTILDLFVQGGVLADLAFIWLVIMALRNGIRYGMAGLPTAIFSLMLFGMTNLIIRQPIFWFIVALSLVQESPWNIFQRQISPPFSYRPAPT